MKEKVISRAVDINAAIDTSLLEDAHKLLASKKIPIDQVRYVNNSK